MGGKKSDLGSGDKKKRKKCSENDQLTGHFQSFFLKKKDISRTNSKASKVNQQSFLNI